MSIKQLKPHTPKESPTGKIRLLSEVKWYPAPRGAAPETSEVVSRILAVCALCGLRMGTGEYHAKAIAMPKQTKSEYWCEYCAQENPQMEVVWILTTTDYERLGTTLTRRKFQQLVEAAA